MPKRELTVNVVVFVFVNRVQFRVFSLSTQGTLINVGKWGPCNEFVSRFVIESVRLFLSTIGACIGTPNCNSIVPH